MDTANLCPGCFNQKEGQKPCPHCDYIGKLTEASLYLTPGTMLADKYIIGKVLGQGGFGITYLAWDLNLDLKLAVKEFFPQGMVSRLPGKCKLISTDGEGKGQFAFCLERFLNEAKTLARFENHPNIVTVRDYFRANNTAYMVMSYIEGLTLEQYLFKVGCRITLSKAIEIILPVMDALKEVHAEGVLHRDISPDNIFIDNKGRIVLIDFGAARQEIKENSKSLTVILKAGYTPEEQYRRQGKQGPWTDVYAVGATLYRMICGEPPPEAIDRLVEDTIIAPSKLGVEISFEQEECLSKALAVNMKDRYSTIVDFLNTILDCAEKAADQKVESCLNYREEIDANSLKHSHCLNTPVNEPLHASGESLAAGIDTSAPGKEQKESREVQSGRLMFVRKTKIASITVVGIVVVLIAMIFAYTNYFMNETGEDDPVGIISQQEENVISLPKTDETTGVRGNNVGNIINAGYAAKQGKYIYYHNGLHGGRIYKYNIDNNQSVQLNDYSSLSINVYGDQIYYSNQDQGYRIYSLKVDGIEQKRLNDDYSSNINIVDDWIYYRNWDDGESVYKIRLDGSERTKINGDSTWHINVVGDWIYYRNQDDGNRIYRIRVDGSERSRLNSDRSWFVNVVDNHIYYCNEDDGWQIYRLNTDGTAKLRLNNDQSGYLNVVENWIYYVNRSDGNKIYRVDLNGGSRSRINDDDSCCINVVGDWIYYKNMGAGDKFYRIKVDGSNREVVN